MDRSVDAGRTPGPEPAGSVTTATVRYFAAARAAAGTTQEQFTVHGSATISRLLEVAVDRHGPALAGVLPRCSYLLDSLAVHGTDSVLTDGQVLDVLPPFAGG